jgi:hypothetical protein
MKYAVEMASWISYIYHVLLRLAKAFKQNKVLPQIFERL